MTIWSVSDLKNNVDAPFAKKSALLKILQHSSGTSMTSDQFDKEVLPLAIKAIKWKDLNEEAKEAIRDRVLAWVKEAQLPTRRGKPTFLFSALSTRQSSTKTHGRPPRRRT